MTRADPTLAVREHYDAYPYDFWYQGHDRLQQQGPGIRAWLQHVDGTGPILDAGCGAGLMMNWLREVRAGAPIVGADLSFASLVRARANYPARVIQADLAALPFPDRTFRAVVCRGVLHHTTRPQAVLAEMGRVLQPNGMCYLRVYRRGVYRWIYRFPGGIFRWLHRRAVGDWLLRALAFLPFRVVTEMALRRATGNRVSVPKDMLWRFFADQFLSPVVHFWEPATIIAWASGAGLNVKVGETVSLGHQVELLFVRRP